MAKGVTIDPVLKAEILKAIHDEGISKLMAAHVKNPRYGVRRLAIELEWSEDKTRRIRNLANAEVLRKAKRKKNTKTPQEIDSPENKLRNYWVFKDPNNPREMVMILVASLIQS